MVHCVLQLIVQTSPPPKKVKIQNRDHLKWQSALIIPRSRLGCYVCRPVSHDGSDHQNPILKSFLSNLEIQLSAQVHTGVNVYHILPRSLLDFFFF